MVAGSVCAPVPHCLHPQCLMLWTFDCSVANWLDCLLLLLCQLGQSSSLKQLNKSCIKQASDRLRSAPHLKLCHNLSGAEGAVDQDGQMVDVHS